MKLYFVRHGETEWNQARKIQGRADIPLNEFGRILARKTGAGLKDVPFDLCYTSPLSRARETAELILNGREVPILEDARIIEMSFGEYEGKCCSRAGWDLPAEFHRFFDGPERYKAPPGGENFADVKKRTGEFLQELYQMQLEQEESCKKRPNLDEPDHDEPYQEGAVQKWSEPPKSCQESHILIVTHGAALGGLLNNIKGGTLVQYWGEGVHKNCAVTEVQVTGGIPEILAENVVYYDDEVTPWGDL